MDIEIKDGGTYRIYPIRLQGVALNAYGSSATTSGQNVCLYKDTPSDTIKESLSYDTTKAKKDGDTNAVSIDIVSMTLPNNQYRIVLEGETK